MFYLHTVAMVGKVNRFAHPTKPARYGSHGKVWHVQPRSPDVVSGEHERPRQNVYAGEMS